MNILVVLGFAVPAGNSTPVEEFSVSAVKDDCESRCCGLSGGLGAFS